MPDISTPANAFAIVGLAGVIIRYSIQVSDLYVRWRDASKAVARLLMNLKDLSELVAEVRSFANE
jgi:hypothetical protein